MLPMVCYSRRPQSGQITCYFQADISCATNIRQSRTSCGTKIVRQPSSNAVRDFNASMALPKSLCSSPELPFDVILLRTGQRGHFADTRFGRNAVGKDNIGCFVQRSSRESSDETRPKIR